MTFYPLDQRAPGKTAEQYSHFWKSARTARTAWPFNGQRSSLAAPQDHQKSIRFIDKTHKGYSQSQNLIKPVVS